MVDFDHGSEKFDELFSMEIRRRRERDFYQDSTCASPDCLQTEEYDKDFECDSLCFESEVISEVRTSDELSCDSSSDTTESIEMGSEATTQGNNTSEVEEVTGKYILTEGVVV